MDGVKIMQKINEISNNKNKINNNKMHNKPLLQSVVINNMNKNYKLTQNYINCNNNNVEQMTMITEEIEMTDGICDR